MMNNKRPSPLLINNDGSFDRKKFRESHLNDAMVNVSMEHAQESMIKQTTTWRLEENKLRNLLLFLSHLDASLFQGYEGQYVVVSNGEVWPTSFVSVGDVAMEEGMSIYLVPPS